MENISDKSQWKGSLKNTWPVLLKMVKDTKNMEAGGGISHHGGLAVLLLKWRMDWNLLKIKFEKREKNFETKNQNWSHSYE